MVDKIATVPKSELGRALGHLDDEDVVRLNQSIIVFLALEISPRSTQAQ